MSIRFFKAFFLIAFIASRHKKARVKNVVKPADISENQEKFAQ